MGTHCVFCQLWAHVPGVHVSKTWSVNSYKYAVSTLNQSVTAFGSLSLSPYMFPPMPSGLTPDKPSRFTLHQLTARTSYLDSHSPYTQRMMVTVLLKQNTSGSVGQLHQLHCVRASAENIRETLLTPRASGAAAQFTGTLWSKGWRIVSVSILTDCVKVNYLWIPCH